MSRLHMMSRLRSIWLSLVLALSVSAPLGMAQSKNTGANANPSSAPGGAQVGKSKPERPRRMALLIAAQEGHPDMQLPDAPFPALQYPTRDVVLMYVALKNPSAGRFDHVKVVASRQRLEKLRLAEAERLTLPNLSNDERKDSENIIKGIADILADDDTAQDTKEDWLQKLADNSQSPEEKARLMQERLAQCPEAEGHSPVPLLFPCALDIQDAIEGFKKDITERDEALVYFSGHGFRTSPFKNGALNVASRMLVAADSYIDRGQKGEPAYNTVSVGNLLEGLAADDCQQVLVILAACASPQGKGGEGGSTIVYLPPVVRKLNTKSGGSKEIQSSHPQRSLIVLGASQEEAIESLDLPILGDVFTFYLRTAIEDRLSRLSTLPKGASPDWDKDGAFSVEEVFFLIDRVMENQVPYLINWQGRDQVFALRGKPLFTVRKAMLFPPDNITLARRTLKGILAPDSPREVPVKLRLDGEPVENPQVLDSKLRRYELVADDGDVRQSVRYAPSASEQVLWQKIWDLQGGELSLASGLGSMLGPPGSGSSSQLWHSAGLKLSLHSTRAFWDGGATRLDVGGVLAFDSSAPSQGGSIYTTQYQLQVAGGVRLQQALNFPTHPLLRLGLYPGLSYLSLFEYRKSMLVGNVMGDLGLSWQLSRGQSLGLGMSLQGFYADLDCAPENVTDETLLARRCEVSADASGNTVYSPSPALYLRPALSLGWSWGF